MPSETASPAVDPCDFTRFVATSGEEGEIWLAAYRREAARDIVRGTDHALSLLRRRQLDAGRALLEDTRARLAQLEGAPPSVVRVLERWVHGVNAYYLYCAEDFDAAERELVAAHGAVTAALSLAPFLLPLANHCHEFRLHHARIARNQRRWREMQRHIDEVRAMIEDREPLCELTDGTAVYYSTLRRYYASLPCVSAEQQACLQSILDDAHRLRLFNRFVQELYILPGFVIACP